MDAEEPSIGQDRLVGRSWAANGFVNGLQGGSKVKSLGHSLTTMRTVMA